MFHLLSYVLVVPLTAQILIPLISLKAFKGEILIFKINNIPICKRNEVTDMNVAHTSMPVLPYLITGCSECIVDIVQVLRTFHFHQ